MAGADDPGSFPEADANAGRAPAPGEPAARGARGLAGLTWLALMDIVCRAGRATEAPVAFLALLDRGLVRNLFHGGLPGATQTQLAGLGMQSIIEGRAVIDTAGDDEMCGADPSAWAVRFRASIPVLVAGGHVIGSLTVVDSAARSLEPEQRTLLEELAREVGAHLDWFHVAPAFAEGVL